MLHRTVLFLFTLLLVLPMQGGVRRALVIGLGTHKDASWQKINGDRDVPLVKQMLQGLGYSDIHTLVNEEATKAAIVQKFDELTGKCRKGDVVYIHYSGHGQLMTDLDGDETLRDKDLVEGWDQSWIPYDAYMNYCEHDRGEKHLSDDEVAKLLSGIRRKIGETGQLVVVIDACHSGDATCGEPEECVRGIDARFSMPLNTECGEPVLIEEDWLTVSACKPDQLCMEMRHLNIGKLTYALSILGNQLRDMDKTELEERLNAFMKMNEGSRPQNPVVSGRK